MDSPDAQLLANLILDVKKDVSDMKKDLSDTKEMSYANSIVLDEHMRRSEAAESRLDVQEEKLDRFIQEMVPIQEHVKTISLLTRLGLKVLKVLTAIATLVATAATILKLR